MNTESHGDMGKMMEEMTGVGGEMDRHEAAAKNCAAMDQAAAEEDMHIEKMQAMMKTMKTHMSGMMSGTDANAMCSMMGDGGMMNGGGMMGH